MGHSCKKESNLKKRSYTYKNGSHLEKRVSVTQKWFTLTKAGHAYKIGSHLKNGSHLQKELTHKKVNPYKNGSHLQNLITFTKLK